MEAIFERCCGIDVQKETMTACIMIGDNGKVTKKEIRTYSTMTEGIEQLRDWLKSDILGVSGGEMIKEIIKGNTDERN